MCFSPEASFTGGILISAIGILTIRKVHEPSQILFASIPLFFGIQQLAEGSLWLMLRSTEYNLFKEISTYVFLMMAQVIWPVMIPLSVLLLEESKRKKKILVALLLVGIILSGYYAFCLLSFKVTPVIEGFHIKYQNEFPESLAMFAFIFYLTATVTPLFVSSLKKTHLLGILMTLSCIVTAIFFTQYLTSVWCFFAALISGVIFWILTDVKKKFNLERLLLLNIHKQNTDSSL
jgi:hypothetical protein